MMGIQAQRCHGPHQSIWLLCFLNNISCIPQGLALPGLLSSQPSCECCQPQMQCPCTSQPGMHVSGGQTSLHLCDSKVSSASNDWAAAYRTISMMAAWGSTAGESHLDSSFPAPDHAEAGTFIVWPRQPIVWGQMHAPRCQQSAYHNTAVQCMPKSHPAGSHGIEF